MTIRLTVAQALVRFLAVQYTERDGVRQRLIGATWGIFGHGNVAGLGQALIEYGDDMPFHQGRNEQSMVHAAVGYARQSNRLSTHAVTTSIGKLLLADLDEEDLRSRITAASFSGQQGPNAKVSLEELRDELGQIREQGWSLQDEELAHGLRSIAGPVMGANGRVVAGVNIAVQARDWSSQRIIRELKPVVLATCAEISALMSTGQGG
jgi:hypothetical protein